MGVPAEAKTMPTGDAAKSGAMEWGGGLFGCLKDLDVIQLLVAWCIPCVLSAKNAEKAGQGEFLKCALIHCCCDICFCLSAYMRGKYEEHTGRANSGIILNCCLHYCCHCCAVMQEARALGTKLQGAPATETMER